MNQSRLLRYVLITLALLAPVMPAFAQTVTTFNVNSTADTRDQTIDSTCFTGKYLDAGNTVKECTLRAALDEANASPNATYVINLPAGTYAATTTVSCPFGAGAYTGTPFCLAANITLNGADPATTILDGGGSDRTVFVGYLASNYNGATSTYTTVSNYTVAINNVTVQNGVGNGGYTFSGGGGIYSTSNLTVSNSILTRNTSTVDYGSAIENNRGNMVLTGCTIKANSGTAVYAAQNSGDLSIDLSQLLQNVGASTLQTYYSPSLHISNSTFSGNQASGNAVVGPYGTPTTVVNTTVSNNSGNAFYLSTSVSDKRPLTLNNDTVYGNSGTYGIIADVLYLSNSIITGQLSVNGSTYYDLGHNLLQSADNLPGSTNDPTTQIGVDPMLGYLETDGGTIPVMRPGPGSPALAGGSTAAPGSSTSGACTALDANGYGRGKVGGVCTIGAAEPLAGLQILKITPASGGIGGQVTLQVAGSGFDPGSTFVLKNGGTTLTPAQVTVSIDTYGIGGALDLTNAAVGSYDVVVTTPTGMVTAAGAFTVQPVSPPQLGAYVLAPSAVRQGLPATYFLNYSNPGNTDVYLVPVFLQTPAAYSGLLLTPLLAPPATNGQVLKDFSNLSITVDPKMTTDRANILLLLPVVPAGSSGTVAFSLTSPPTAAHGSSYTLNASVSAPFGLDSQGTIAANNMSGLLASAQDYALNTYGVTLTAQDLASMATYATSALANEIAAGQQALLLSGGGRPVLFSVSQLVDDVAAYGASLEGYRAQVSPPQVVASAVVHPRGGGGGGGGGNVCSGAPLPPGTSCQDDHKPFPTPPSNGNCNSIVNLLYGDKAPPSCTPPKPPACPSGHCDGNPVNSLDPNEIDGPTGVGTSHYTQANSPFGYSIEFENSATATASAQDVTVTNQIDVSKLDPSTFQLGPISFGPFTLTPPKGSTSFTQAVDLRPNQNVVLNVQAGLNTTSGLATWTFTSLDPATYLATTDATAGFLPPDSNPPAGIGHVTYTINPLAAVADAAQICNSASIVFDTNAAIATTPFCNTKDVSAPTSMVQALPAKSSPMFTVSWTGSDTGSGVGTYTIYVSDNGGAFTAWLTGTAATSGVFTGVPNHTYGFYSIATDLVGNVEAAKTMAEASTFIAIPAASFSVSSLAFGSVTVGSYSSAQVTVTSNGTMDLSITGFTLSDTANFSQSTTCGGTLAVGQTCTVTVTFNPSPSASTTSPTTATLSLVSNAYTAPTPVGLSGQATANVFQSLWIVNGNQTLSNLSNAGNTTSPGTGYAGGGSGIAIDSMGDVWSGTAGGSSVVEFTKAGVLAGNYSGAGISSPAALAISGNYVWVVNANSTVSLLQLNGTAMSPATGFTNISLSTPTGIAIDNSGNVWVTNSGDSSLTEFLGGADPVVTPLATAAKNVTQGARP